VADERARWSSLDGLPEAGEGRAGSAPRFFDNKDIDAVSIATPNQLARAWRRSGPARARQGCVRGKSLGAHNIWEGRRMVEAAHKYNRIVQHGVQLRSSEALQEAVRLLRGGVIGKVYMGGAGWCIAGARRSEESPARAPPDYLGLQPVGRARAQERPFSKK